MESVFSLSHHFSLVFYPLSENTDFVTFYPYLIFYQPLIFVAYYIFGKSN